MNSSVNRNEIHWSNWMTSKNKNQCAEEKCEKWRQRMYNNGIACFVRGTQNPVRLVSKIIHEGKPWQRKFKESPFMTVKNNIIRKWSVDINLLSSVPNV